MSICTYHSSRVFGKKKLLVMQSLARKMFHGGGEFIVVFMSSFQQGFFLGYHIVFLEYVIL